MKKDTGSGKKNIDYIAKEISDGVYINVSRLPRHELDFEALEESFRQEDSEKPDSNKKPLRDNQQHDGNETIGIP